MKACTLYTISGIEALLWYGCMEIEELLLYWRGVRIDIDDS